MAAPAYSQGSAVAFEQGGGVRFAGPTGWKEFAEIC